MKESLFRRYALLLGTVLIALYSLAPSFWKAEQRPSFFFSDGLKLGLDLQGGLHLTMQVQVDEALLKNAESRAADFTNRLKPEGIVVQGVPRVVLEDGVTVTTLTFNSSAERDKGRRLLEEQNANTRFELLGETDLVSKGQLQDADFLRNSAVERAMEILRSRIDQFGVAEPVLLREGSDRIVIQLPGLKDQERALKLIGTTAQLEFHIVHDDNASLSQQVQAARRDGKLSGEPTREELGAALAGSIPADAKLAFLVPIRDTSIEEGENVADVTEPPQPMLLRSRVEMTGEAVVDASMTRDPQTNEPNVTVRLTPSAARDFEALTGQNVNKQLAIVLDGTVKSAPNIQEKIGGGQVRITGQFTDVEAADLAMVLRSGALPAPIKVIQNITVGATLGKDSINKGMVSGIIGFLMVCIFMAVYYRISGVIADLALVLNNILLLGSLSVLDATLTLPGIAGIVLSMGMAVDSNVLIFERIREELEMGRPIPASIRAGFEKAFWTIIDSHVTTLITAIVLFQFGTGPIKGFAVTLSIGVILNLFTALVGTRVVYDHMLMNSWLKRLRFLQIMRKPNFEVVKNRRYAFMFSVTSMVIAFVALFQIQRGNANLGIDFVGGTMVTVGAATNTTASDARTALEAAGLSDGEVQVGGDGKRLLIRLHQAEGEPGELTTKVLAGFQKSFSDRQFTIEGAEVIGAAVSKDLRDASLLAVILSLVGILSYLSLRFDFRYGVAAAVATFHDVFFVLAIFYLLGFQINLLLVTALLTIAGYSLTDTVVIFDRIRENRNRFPTMPIGDAINTSVNEVLMRTVITSSTTMMTLVALVLFGGPVLFDFSLALLLGVLIGTYSSVFVASPILYEWETRYGAISDGEAPAARPAHGPSRSEA